MTPYLCTPPPPLWKFQLWLLLSFANCWLLLGVEGTVGAKQLVTKDKRSRATKKIGP